VDPLKFFSASRLLVVAGKGGVGKTTVTAALARAAADRGLRVLVLGIDGKETLAGLLGGPATLGDDEVTCATGLGPDGRGEIRARLVRAGHALSQYLDDHGLRRITGRLLRHGVLDIVATAAPGIDDLLVLGRVKQLETSGVADLIVLDAPAAGHAVTFLQSARGLLDAVASGPVHTQAAEVGALLSDPARCQVVLVTLPEETPVNEVIDTAFALEDRVGIALGPVVVNGLYPDRPGLAAAVAGLPEDDPRVRAARFRLEREAVQRSQLDRLGVALPLPQLRLPFQFTAGIGPAEVGVLAEALAAGIVALEAA
jgi:arsenite-transporting ATPase